MAARGARFLLFRRRNRRLRKSASSQSASAQPKKSRHSLLRRGVTLFLRFGGALLICILLGGVGYGARYFLYHSPRFALKALRIKGTHRLSTQAVSRRAAVALGVNLLEIDTHAVETRLLGEPWIKTVAVRRDLPSTLRIEIAEHEPVALVALESLYLCDTDGMVFKRAAPAELAGLPVITGIGRATYVLEPAYARAEIALALQALAAYQKTPTGISRPQIGEVHIDRFVGATLYTRQGLAIQLGLGENAELLTRLLRFDAVMKALREGGSEGRPLMVFLDNRAHPDHVTVRFDASATAR